MIYEYCEHLARLFSNESNSFYTERKKNDNIGWKMSKNIFHVCIMKYEINMLVISKCTHQ